MLEEDKELYITYFGSSADYYLGVLERFSNGQRFVFNPYALLLGLFWFLYRKLYKETMIFVAISVVSGLAQTYLFLNPAINVYHQQIALTVTILLNLSYGFLGNYLYIRKAIKEVEAVKASLTNEEDRKVYLNTKGGTTMHPVFILIIIYLLYIVLLQKFS